MEAESAREFCHEPRFRWIADEPVSIVPLCELRQRLTELIDTDESEATP